MTKSWKVLSSVRGINAQHKDLGGLMWDSLTTFATYVANLLELGEQLTVSKTN